MFIGRSKELYDTKRILFENVQQSSPNILAIIGEAGIGKTSLAQELFRYSREVERFEYRIAKTVYTKSWAELVTEIARALVINIPLKANVPEIEEVIVRLANERSVFLFLDNIVETSNDLISFMSRWVNAKHSRILITINEWLPGGNVPSNCFVYPLNGISEDYVIRDLLGEKNVTIIEEGKIWSTIETLHGNPQRLIYLRWRGPRSKSEILDCVKDLLRVDGGTKNLERVLHNIGFPVDHFLALGRVRIPEIDDALLAHLWDELALGTTEHYTQSLKKLLDEKLLESVGQSKLRLNAGVHVQLQRHLLMVFGKNQIAYIEYFIGEYFRRRVSINREYGNRLQDLESYVYHMIQSGNVESAYTYIFETDELETARCSGFALELERILSQFDLEFERLLKQANIDKENTNNRSETIIRQTIMAVTVKVELGRVYKDLNHHVECLTLMESAAHLLDSIYELCTDRAIVDRFIVSINHLRGIAYSQVGYTQECIQAYFESIRRAAQANIFGVMETLSLGYLAYELKFHNMDESLRIARRAVHFSQSINNRSTLVKNLCSLGQIQSFAGLIEESKSSFIEADKLCRKDPVDARELGRILVNSAVTFIAVRNWREAEKRLKEADELFGESGDRRRKHIGLAYRGIILYHKGQKDEGIRLVRRAYFGHQEIGAVREMTYEALSITWMLGNGIVPKITQLAESGNIQPELTALLEKFGEINLEIFVDFWRKHYAPTLLTLERGTKEI